MTVQYIGTTFPGSYQWGRDEVQLTQTIKNQIAAHWSDQSSLLINTTWFGPQFNNKEYSKFLDICATQQFDNLFLLASVDPVCLTPDQIAQCKDIAGADNLYLLGNFENQYQFNFISTLLPHYFELYTQQQLLPGEFTHVFLNYNRKPHAHRVELVDLLEQQNLIDCGIVTLGNRYTLNEQPNAGNWGMQLDLGIPHDIHTLGNLDIWRSCFLNIVSETVATPWDPLFVTEKTWKPILGLRPFLINGQTKIYQYLRDQGFNTFNHYWPHIDVETQDENQVHINIIKVIEYLQEMNQTELHNIYNKMLPDLLHNQNRFVEFAAEQEYKINHLFT